MSDKDPIDAQAIQFLYSLWDASLPGREPGSRVGNPSERGGIPFAGGNSGHSTTPSLP